MLKKILRELILIRKELQAIRGSMEFRRKILFGGKEIIHSPKNHD